MIPLNKAISLAFFTIMCAATSSCTDGTSNLVCIDALYKTKNITGGAFVMGSETAYPEEFKRNAEVTNFNIDTHEVTNSQFSAFIEATGYVTTAEKPQVGFNVPGAAVFKPPTETHPNWWQFVEGATWRHPEGPDSSIAGQDNFPVVQVSYQDALAYANWSKRDIPTEAEWEYAAKAGTDTLYVWGENRNPDGKEMANTWQGAFPIQNTELDGHPLRAPVGCFAENNFGLYDMIGNVWEWTSSESSTQPGSTVTPHVIKGGSFLCAENFCARYRSAARQFQESDLSTNHVGFRTIERTSEQ